MRFYLVFALSMIGFFSAYSARAQNYQPILTWEAKNYYPNDYAGRALVTPWTKVVVGVEVLNGGKLLDISSADIAWRLDDATLDRGVGMKEVSYVAKKSAGSSQTVRVTISTGGADIVGAIDVSISKPKVTIVAPFTDNVVRGGGQLSFEAIPYFFNVDSDRELSFFWNLNNIVKKSNVGRIFSLNLSEEPTSKGGGDLSVSVQNPNNLIETGRGIFRFKVY